MSGKTLEARERRSIRMVWKTLRLRHVGLAFFWACSMLTFRSSILLSGAANTAGLETLVVIVSFVANMTTLLALAAWVENDPDRIDRLKSWPFAIGIVIGLLAISAAGSIPTAMLPLLLGGAALTGIGYGYFWGSWADCYGRMHPARTSFYLPVAFFLTAALFLGISLLTENLGVPALVLMVPLPLLSLACLNRCRAEKPDGRASRVDGTRRSLAAVGSLLGLIVASLVLSCLFGFVWEMTVFSVGSVNEAHLAPLVANLVVAVIIIGLVLYARTRVDLGMAYRVIVPVIVVLFAVLPFFWETNPVVLNIIMSASYGVFDVIIWSMVVACAYDFAVSGFVIGGIVRALSILLRLVGIGIGYLIMLVPGDSSMLMVGLSCGALYALVMLGLFYLMRRRRRPSLELNVDEAPLPTKPIQPADMTQVDENHAVADMTQVVENCAVADMTQVAQNHAVTGMTQVAQTHADTDKEIGDAPLSQIDDMPVFQAISLEYGLTRREAEVLPYLARGRSAKVVAEALFVSESTIRTHTRRILEKTDLHSKQQLIDLIEHYE